MRSLEEGEIQLIAIDPPFCSGSVRKSERSGEDVQFDDCWKGGVQSYVQWLVPRLRECHRLLKDTGVLSLHLDQSASHYAKVELDKIFGEGNFINEIIWSYKSGGASKRSFAKKHDNILVYSRGKKWTFNVQKEKDYKRKKVGINNGGASCTHFLKDHIGVYNLVIPRDVWEIPIINSQAHERAGYPTQKPLPLYEKIIKAFTNEEDIVADFFCGSGTTLVASQNLGRKWIGADASNYAINFVCRRMNRDHNVYPPIRRA